MHIDLINLLITQFLSFVGTPPQCRKGELPGPILLPGPRGAKLLFSPLPRLPGRVFPVPPPPRPRNFLIFFQDPVLLRKIGSYR